MSSATKGQPTSWKAMKRVLGDSSSQGREDPENPLPPTGELGQPTSPAGDLNSQSPPDQGEGYTIPEAPFRINMIILLFITTCAVGGMLTVIGNLGPISRALGYPDSTATTFISLVSIWKYLGWVVSGFASENFVSKYKLPRPLMLSLVLLLSCFGHLLIAFGVPNSLFVASVIIGFSFGAQRSLISAIILETFGLKYYSTLYNFAVVASLVGMCILNMNVVGRLYNQEALKQTETKGLKMLAGEDLTCTGVECYKKAFIVIAAATLFGCAVSLVLVFRTRKVHRDDINREFREQAEAETAAAATEEGANAVVQLISEVASS